MDLDDSEDINNITVAVYSVTSLAHVHAFLVSEEASLVDVLEDNSLSVEVIIEVASDKVRVEAMLLDREGRRDFIELVDLVDGEHNLVVEVVDDVALLVDQVAFAIHESASFVSDCTVFVWIINYNISLFVAVEVSLNVVFVKSSAHGVWRDFNNVRLDLVLEVIESAVSDNEGAN